VAAAASSEEKVAESPDDSAILTFDKLFTNFQVSTTSLSQEGTGAILPSR